MNPVYSSFIGNALHGSSTTPDMVASSIEIARRSYKKYVKSWFYPRIENAKDLLNRWKKETGLSFLSWREVYNVLKKSKMLYRFPFKRSNSSMVFRNYSIRTPVFLYNFR